MSYLPLFLAFYLLVLATPQFTSGGTSFINQKSTVPVGSDDLRSLSFFLNVFDFQTKVFDYIVRATSNYEINDLDDFRAASNRIRYFFSPYNVYDGSINLKLNPEKCNDDIANILQHAKKFPDLDAADYKTFRDNLKKIHDELLQTAFDCTKLNPLTTQKKNRKVPFQFDVFNAAQCAKDIIAQNSAISEVVYKSLSGLNGNPSNSYPNFIAAINAFKKNLPKCKPDEMFPDYPASAAASLTSCKSAISDAGTVLAVIVNSLKNANVPVLVRQLSYQLPINFKAVVQNCKGVINN